MCAINGFNFNNPELIAKMNKVTKHRGPDGEGVWSEAGITLGHNRLSILDLSTNASQPMESQSGRYQIVFNGEIYNFVELKRELSDYSFKTSGDTEVILAAYEKWGSECFGKLKGIFALAIYDRQKQELILARDPQGVKPLYYYHSSNKFIFSSELKGVLASEEIERNLDLSAFNLYLRLLYVPGPLTMIKGVKKLMPGQLAIIKNGELVLKNFWIQPVSEILSGNRADWTRLVKTEVEKAVERQLVSDRPLGIYLSGGIDSSVILNCVNKVRSDIDTFSVGFSLPDENEMEKFNADFNLARRTAEFYGTNHHEVLLSEAEVVSSFKEVVWQMDEPIANPTAWPLFKLSAFTKDYADVILGGDGGDELFGGYERYRLSLLVDYYQKIIPSWIRKIFSRFDGRFKKAGVISWVKRWENLMSQKEDELRPWLAWGNEPQSAHNWLEANYKQKENDLEFVSWLMETDRKTWLVDFALTLADKMSMAHGIEARVPLLDLDIIALARRIPLSAKVSPAGTKKILKEAFRSELPPYLFNQPKRGFFSPGAKWLRLPKMQDIVRDVLRGDFYPETAKLFNWSEIERKAAEHQEKIAYHSNLLWAVIIFQVWAKEINLNLK